MATATSSGGSTSVKEAMEERKRKRMMSNRESARRSRQRKQRRLDELTAQAGQLRAENAQIVSLLSSTGRRCLTVEAENAVLRAQMAELCCRLRSLDEILCCLNGGGDDEMMMMMNMNVPW